mmetsp:Transcript_31344/g.59613  ORF Transcript_31344/g.59613 Transcript_31344/m.59613 type:complete len:87 (-) Transcript_31344:212-472(-)
MVGLQITQEKNASRIVILQLDTLALHTIIMVPKSIQPRMNVASVLTGLIVTCVKQTQEARIYSTTDECWEGIGLIYYYVYVYGNPH